MKRVRAILLSSFPAWCFGCPSDDDSSDTGADDHTHDSSGAHDSSGGHDSGGSSDTGSSGAAATYCSCVLANCHEPYHAKWGEDEIAAQQACLAEAAALPVNGAPTEMGNFIECRQHFCDLAASDDSVCANALGEAVCM